MTAPVPPVDLDQLETVLAAATPGPWQRWGNHHVCVESDPVGYCEQSADAAAIVAAVNAAPALIAELRDLRAFRDRASALADGWEDDWNLSEAASCLRAELNTLGGS